MASSLITQIKNGNVSGADIINRAPMLNPQYRGGGRTPTFRAIKAPSQQPVIGNPDDGKRPVQFGSTMFNAPKPAGNDNPFDFPTLPGVGSENPFLGGIKIPENQFLRITPEGLQFLPEGEANASPDLVGDAIEGVNEFFADKQVGIITALVGIALIVLALAQIVKPL